MNTGVTWPQIEMAAKQEKWDFVDSNLEPFLDETRFKWALKNIESGDNNRNTRDLAATILNQHHLLSQPSARNGCANNCSIVRSTISYGIG